MKERECDVTSWGEFPLMMTASDITRLGIGIHEARALLNRPDIPVVEYGGIKRIEKYALKRYLQKGVRKG